MSDRILQKYVGRNGASPDNSPEADLMDGDDAENFGSFGWMRGVRDRSVCLELRKKSGAILAVPYAYISRIEYQPSGQILIACGTDSITIKGRNLNGEVREHVRLFQGMTRHRVTWIEETDRPAAMRAEKTGVIVESIEWTTS
jgi:hypothetical protein